MGPHPSGHLKLGEAALALGKSPDTLRRWERAGKLEALRDEHGRRPVTRAEVTRLSGRPPRHPTGMSLSARNRLDGIVRSVEIAGVMALVEVQAGPFLVIAAITRDAVAELGLAARRARDRHGQSDLRDDPHRIRERLRSVPVRRSLRP
jgi:molybdopterin-binding protein